MAEYGDIIDLKGALQHRSEVTKCRRVLMDRPAPYSFSVQLEGYEALWLFDDLRRRFPDFYEMAFQHGFREGIEVTENKFRSEVRFGDILGEYEAGYDKGHVTGYKEGYEKGRTEGCWVYVGIRDKLVKIGFTTSPKNRISHHRFEKLLACFPANISEERKLHIRFKRYLAKDREWFHPSPEILKFAKEKGIHGEVRRELGLKQ